LADPVLYRFLTHHLDRVTHLLRYLLYLFLGLAIRFRVSLGLGLFVVGIHEGRLQDALYHILRGINMSILE
jgi:hypothetical protein